MPCFHDLLLDVPAFRRSVDSVVNATISMPAIPVFPDRCIHRTRCDDATLSIMIKQEASRTQCFTITTDSGRQQHPMVGCETKIRLLSSIMTVLKREGSSSAPWTTRGTTDSTDKPRSIGVSLSKE